MLKKHTLYLLLISMLATFNVFSQYLSPVNPLVNQVIPYYSIDFAWNIHPDASTYHITVASDSDLGSILFDEEVITNTLTHEITGEDTCYWNIVAYNGSEIIMVSDTIMFVVFSPLIFSGVQVWLNGDDVEADVNNKVAVWNDKSDNAFSFVQDDDAKKPVLLSNGLNDFPSLQFDGNDFLSGGDILDIANSSSWSLFVVGKSNASDGTFIAKSLAAGVPNRWALFYESSSLTFLFSDQNGQAFPFAAALSQYHLTSVHANRAGQNLTYRIDGVLKTSNNSISSNTYNFDSPYRCLVGGYSNGADNGEIYYLNGNISEIIIYNSLSEDQSLFVENMLRYKYYPTLYKEPVSLGFDILIADNFCDTTLDAGAGFSQYLWSTEENTQTIAVNETGFYSVTVTDSYGVTSSDNIYVLYPEIGYSFADTTICAGDEIVWETGLGSFYHEWNTGYNGGSALTIGGPYPEGNYRVTIYDLSGCWATSDLINVQVDNFPNQISLGADRDECYGTNIGLISPPTGIVSYLWNDGSTSSVISATESGNYHVTVTNNRGCLGIDTVNISISGYAPIVDFDADTVCLGEETQFTNHTTITPPFEISEWNWDFGDSETSYEENPVHNYDAPGVYMVQLFASTDAGCNNYFQKEVLVLPNPEAGFSVNMGLHHCLNTEVSFFNEATDPNIVEWHWNFGDGTESSEENPQHVFTTSGTFEVWQKVTSSNGCSDSTMLSLNIDTDFQLPDDFHCLTPASEAYFYNLNPLVNFRWTLSSNTLYYRIEISDDAGFENIILSSDITDNSYSQAIADTGTYYWRVFAFNMCNDFNETAVDSFFVQRFASSDMSFWLDASEQISVIDNKVTTWHDKSQNNYIGLQDNALFQPQYSVNDSLINNQASVHFENHYINFGPVLPLDSIRDYYMFVKYNAFSNFGFVMSKGVNGDGSFAVNNEGDICNMRLYYDNVITTTDWCMPIDSFFLVNIRMYPEERIEIYHNQNQVYGIDINVDLSGISVFDLVVGNTQYGDFTFPLQGEIAEIIIYDTVLDDSRRGELFNYFHNKYAPPVNLGRDVNITYNFCDTTISAEKPWFVDYNWSSGETTPSITVNAMQSGQYSVTVTDIFGFTSTDQINVQYPWVNQISDTVICVGQTLHWNAAIDGDYSYQWTGGLHAPQISITEAGNYGFTITDNLGCEYRSNIALVGVSYFSELVSFGTNDTLMCIGNTLGLVSGADEAVYYIWHNGYPFPETTIIQPGVYCVTVIDQYGCQGFDCINVSIQGTAPEALFSVSNTCVNNPSVFTDQSIPASGAIASHEWYIGGALVSGESQFEYVFAESGVFNVMLVVTAEDGCHGNTTQEVIIGNLPQPAFMPLVACAGNATVFTDQSTAGDGDISSVTWFFENIQSGTGSTTVYTFDEAGVFPVGIVVENSFGCIDSIQTEVEVKPSPLAVFLVSPACEGSEVYFVNQSQAFPPWDIIEYSWCFGDDSYSSVSNPSHIFSQHGNYQVVLCVQALNGCSDTIMQTVLVNELPVADFNGTDACMSTTHTISDNSSIGSGAIASWTYIVDNIGIYELPNPQLTFEAEGEYEVIYIVQSDAGCVDSVIKTITVYPLPVSGFSAEPLWGAAPLIVDFTNNSTGAESVFWSFGDGQQSSLMNPSHTFDSAGSYTVVLTAISSMACQHTSQIQIDALEPIVDIALLNLNIVNENGFLKVAFDIVNAGALPVNDLDIVMSVAPNTIVRESINQLLFQGEVLHYTMQHSIFVYGNALPPSLCVEAEINDYPELRDVNRANQILCDIQSNSTRVYDPYPNPTTNTLHLDIIATEPLECIVEIYNSTGMQVLSQNVEMPLPRNYHLQFDVSLFSSGLYNIVIKHSDFHETRQFIKL